MYEYTYVYVYVYTYTVNIWLIDGWHMIDMMVNNAMVHGAYWISWVNVGCQLGKTLDGGHVL